MYLLSMRRGVVGLGILLVSTALGCQPTNVTRPPGNVQSNKQREPLSRLGSEATRQAVAVALTSETARHLRDFGFSFDATHLRVRVAAKEPFVDGLAVHATHFEMPGQFEALSGVSRLFGMKSGRSPEELKALACHAAGEATLAYYDHVEKTLVFRDDADARISSLESLVAHELIHAYQDEAMGGLESFIRGHRESLDSLRAVHGVLEGHAVVVGAGLEWSRRGVSIDQLEPDITDASVGRLAAGESISVVYEAGRRFILLRYRQGGWPSVMDALNRPPSSTEQLLHPDKFRRDLPTDITLPAVPEAMKDVSVVFEGTLGELLLYSRLLHLAGDLNLARIAATGWDGDRLRVYALPNGGYAASWRILWDRRVDAQQFEQVVLPTFAGRIFVGLHRFDRVTDLVYSDVEQHYHALVKSMATHRPQLHAYAFDADSTAAVEKEWQEAERLRPFVDANRWTLPEYGMSFQVPNGFRAVTLRGVDILVAPAVNGFRDNVSLAYEQDLFGGDVARYVSDMHSQTRHTSQKWISQELITVGSSRAAIIQLEIPSDQRLMSLAMLVVPRKGRWVTVTCASTAARTTNSASNVLSGIIQTLRLEQRVNPTRAQVPSPPALLE